MTNCPSCSVSNVDSARFCSECGAALRSQFAETVLQDDLVDAAASLSDNTHHGQFLPGTVIAGRYRIVSMVGKGGMGEIYRADDLKLGQTVALKFLPAELSSDPGRLKYFHDEVRLARQISHPNICRVYDVGEVVGQHFLSMEYIDGEDLKVLLRRIGRLPREKGVEIAQQLCVGLAAAHNRGVLHRDLKPANIMIDGRGQVRITDFGLAKLVNDGAQGEFAGTPAYMAPEQLSRGEATVRSDLYSLGLVLFEMFTGEAVHSSDSIAAFARTHEQSSPPRPSNSVDDVDPAVKRIINRCLQKNPHERPESALAVAAALPGGDPLAMVLAAGETPSPTMVAAAGGIVGLHRTMAVILLISTAVCLLTTCWLAEWTHVVNQTELRDPAVLLDKTQALLREDLDYNDHSVDPSLNSVHGFVTENGALRFWYRQRIAGRFTVGRFWHERDFSRGRPTFRDPSWEHPHELGMQLDPVGALRFFRARPPQTATVNAKESDPSGLPWEEWFSNDSTGLVLARGDGKSTVIDSRSDATVLRVVPDRSRTPPDAFDAVRVWTGKDKENGQVFFVVAAAYRGKPVYFEIFSEEQFAKEPSRPPENVGESIWYTLKFLVIFGGIVLACSNIRSGHGDRRGAFRLAGFVFGSGIVIWIAQARHSLQIGEEFRSFLMGSTQALSDAVVLWIVYVAFEPVVRRRWPQILISWTRLLDGRGRDPVVGRDLMLGAAAGLVISLIFQFNLLAHTWLQNQAPDIKGEVLPISLAGFKELVASALESQLNGINVSATVTMALVLFRVLLRSERWAIAVWHVVLIVFLILSSGSSFVVGLLPIGLIVGVNYLLLRKYGFLANVVMMTVQTLASTFPLTLGINHWYFSHGLFAIALICATTLFGFYTSQGNRSVAGSPDATSI